MIDVIVTGYPKSGNTWATRLVADLIGCPVAGFWNSRKAEIAREGVERVSSFRCFKAHQTVPEILSTAATDSVIIYVVRDARDVVVSGAHYFHFYRLRLLETLFTKTSRWWRDSRRILEPLLTSESYRTDRMVDVLLTGPRRAGRFLAVPWAEHCRPCIETGQFFVRYEDLLQKPGEGCLRILSHLGLHRSEHEIREAIERQSFERKREAFVAAGDTHQAGFLRSGLAEQWRTALSNDRVQRIEAAIGNELQWFGYPVRTCTVAVGGAAT